MIETLINLLSKETEYRNKIVLSVLQILFSLMIAIKTYEYMYGAILFTPIDSYVDILYFFTSGDIVKYIIVFGIVWFCSYSVLAKTLGVFIAFLNNIFYKLFQEYFIKFYNIYHIQITPSNSDKKFYNIIMKLFDKADIVEINNDEYKANKALVKLGKEIKKLKAGKTVIPELVYKNSIIAIIQLIIIYNWYHFDFKTQSLIIASIFKFGITIVLCSSFFSYGLAKFINDKHGRISNLLKDLENAKEKSLTTIDTQTINV